jgi:protein-L-isoaspartate(D-aspartate) O-methyltransferase
VAVDDALTLPGRWVDFCDDREPDPSWIAIAWRTDDPDGSGARSALGQLLHPEHTETYREMEADWRSWVTFTAALADSHLSVVSLHNQIRGIGHTSATSAAVILTDATVISNSPDSASLTVLRSWLEQWERAGRPAPDTFSTRLVPYDGPDLPGWDLHVLPPTAELHEARRTST